jgi:thiopurine S-methyltransferase
MHSKFWHKRWATSDIPWHESAGSSLLAENLNALSLRCSTRIFVPLCGKTLDIRWLLGQGYSVVAIELSEMAVNQLFSELGSKPKIVQSGSLKHYSVNKLDVFIGDFFVLTADLLGTVDAVFDRASLVALPIEMRVKYTRHLADITAKALQLLIVFEYHSPEMVGPPFSISMDEITKHYSEIYAISLLSSRDVSGKLRGDLAALENAYLLQPVA